MSTQAELRQARALRFAFGVSLSVAFAYALEYGSYSLTTVLVATMLASPAPRPGPRALLGILLSIVIAFGFGIAISLLVLTSPLLFVLATGLLLFRIFYAATGGMPAFVVLMLLLGVILIPAVGAQSLGLAVDFALDFIVASSLALAGVLVAHAIVPDPPAAATLEPATGAAPPTPADRARMALRSTAVVLPLVVLFMMMQWTGKLTALLFVAILAMAPGASQGRSAGLGMLAGTLIGGAFALAIYVLTSLNYSFVFLILLVLLACLLLADRIFSDHPAAALFAKAPSAMLILISSVDPFLGDETSAKFFSRVQMVAFASLYVVLAFQVWDLFSPANRSAASRAIDDGGRGDPGPAGASAA